MLFALRKMLHIYCLFILLLLYDTEGKPTEIKCPDYCKCDTFETFRRATCQNKKLYSIEIDIPPQAEILDLSYNQISELGNHVFLEIGLTNLKLLNLSHNKVSQIHLNGFEGLTNLKTLDLSFNMLRYFTEQWFVSLNSLQELYLRGNNLKSINSEPRLNLKYLRVLDLSLCGITNLHPEIFQNTPNLQVLDISENYLINVDLTAISSLAQLNTLIVKDNHFNCKNGGLSHLKTYARTKGISYRDPCPKHKKHNKTEKFQRMMLQEPDAPEKNVWIYDEVEEKVKNTKIIEVCNDATKKKNSSSTYVDNVLMEVIELSPIISIVTVLVFGMLIGLVIGCSVDITHEHKIKEQTNDYVNLPDGTAPYRRRTRSVDSKSLQRQDSSGSTFRPRTRSGGSRKMIREDRNFLIMNEVGLSDSTPVIPRKTYV